MMTPSHHNPAVPPWTREVEADPAADIDVQHLLRQGRDPFAVLTAAAAAVPVGRGMAVTAPFDPIPLRDHLAGQGFGNHAERLPDGRFRAWFLRHSADGAGAAVAAPPQEPEAGRPRFALGDDGLHLDVRGLSPPGPMLEILSFLDGGAHEGPLTVHVPHFPVHLIPELEDRGWAWQVLAEEPGHVTLRLRPEEG